jgi:hypothetical protein
MKLLATLNKSSSSVTEELNVIFNRKAAFRTTLVDFEILKKAFEEKDLSIIMDTWDTSWNGYMNDHVQTYSSNAGRIDIIKSSGYVHLVMIHDDQNDILYGVEGDEDYMETYTPHLIEPDMVTTSVEG